MAEQLQQEEGENMSCSWEEIMNRDVLVKRIHNSDQSLPSASFGTSVICNISSYFLTSNSSEEDNTTDLSERVVSSEPFEVLVNERYKIGEGDAFPALELALRHSRVGDEFLLRTSNRFAFGLSGRDTTIPPNTDLELRVQVLQHVLENEIDKSFIQSQISSILSINSGKFKVSISENIDDDIAENEKRWAAFSDLCFRKEAGNRWFRYRDFGRAARAYSKGTKVADEYFKAIDKYQGGANEMVKMGEDGQMQINPDYREGGQVDGQDPPPDDDRDTIIFLAYLSCLNNLSACHMEQGENLKARDLCIKVLEMDPNNLKALLRAARSSLALHVSKYT